VDYVKCSFDFLGWFECHPGSAAWASVPLLIFTSVFALGTFCSQKNSSRKAAAVLRVGDAIKDLTTGSVADARNDVYKFARGLPVRNEQENSKPSRHESRKYTDDVRQKIFILLWALHRLSPITSDIKLVPKGLCTVLSYHVGFIDETFASLIHAIGDKHRDDFEESAQEAGEAVAELGKALVKASVSFKKRSWFYKGEKCCAECEWCNPPPVDSCSNLLV